MTRQRITAPPAALTIDGDASDAESLADFMAERTR